MPALRFTDTDSLLVVIDIQDKLLAVVPTGPALVREAAFLLDVAKLLAVPVMVTEQYPKGLGPTVPELATRLPAERREKTAFSCCGAAGFLTELRGRGRRNVILVGMEAHVCVQHTALDLLDAGYGVFVPADAVASRSALDREVALRRLDRAGAVVTTAESVVFEWTGHAGHPQFKAVSKLLIERSLAR